MTSFTLRPAAKQRARPAAVTKAENAATNPKDIFGSSNFTDGLNHGLTVGRHPEPQEYIARQPRPTGATRDVTRSEVEILVENLPPALNQLVLTNMPSSSMEIDGLVDVDEYLGFVCGLALQHPEWRSALQGTFDHPADSILLKGPHDFNAEQLFIEAMEHAESAINVANLQGERSEMRRLSSESLALA